MNLKCISAYAVKHSELSNHYFPCKNMCYLFHNANVVMDFSDFQQKYVMVKSLRRSGSISNILLNKKLKRKLSLFQPIRVYDQNYFRIHENCCYYWFSLTKSLQEFPP